MGMEPKRAGNASAFLSLVDAPTVIGANDGGEPPRPAVLGIIVPCRHITIPLQSRGAVMVGIRIADPIARQHGHAGQLPGREHTGRATTLLVGG